MRRLTALAVMLVVGCALATWVDNFDSYNLGSINGQGGWEGWAGDPGAAGLVTNVQYLSPYQSQQINGPHDSVHKYSGYTSGVWYYGAKMFIPSDYQGGGTSTDFGTFFILLSKYTNGGNDTRWSVQFGFDSRDGLIHADCGSTNEVTYPYVTGQWADIKVRIDLGYDWTQVYYNNHLLDDPTLPDHPVLGGGYSWTKGVFGQYTDGTLNIGAVDLFANSSSAVYYDDMYLLPEPASLLLVALGALLRRR